MSDAQQTPILRLRKVSKNFGGVQALKDVNLEVYPSQVVALAGDNAAGKSTLARMVAGVYPPSAGSIELGGQDVSITSTQQALRLGIATVFQELSLCENLDAVQNIFLGRELHAPNRLLDEQRMASLAVEFLRQLNAKIPDVRVPLYSLSGGQRQCVAIARTLVTKPRLVILDEPTAALSVAQTAEVLTYIESLREMGMGVILIGHNLTDLRAVADQIVVLRHGQVNGRFPTDQGSYEDIIAAITGAVRYEE